MRAWLGIAITTLGSGTQAIAGKIAREGMPAGDATVQIDGRALSIQRPALGLVLGMTFDYE